MSSGVLRNFPIGIRQYLMIGITTVLLLIPFMLMLSHYQTDLMEAKKVSAESETLLNTGHNLTQTINSFKV